MVIQQTVTQGVLCFIYPSAYVYKTFFDERRSRSICFWCLNPCRLHRRSVFFFHLRLELEFKWHKNNFPKYICLQNWNIRITDHHYIFTIWSISVSKTDIHKTVEHYRGWEVTCIMPRLLISMAVTGLLNRFKNSGLGCTLTAINMIDDKISHGATCFPKLSYSRNQTRPYQQLVHIQNFSHHCQIINCQKKILKWKLKSDLFDMTYIWHQNITILKPMKKE